MSRIAKIPILVPKNIKIIIKNKILYLINKKNKIKHIIHNAVNILYKNNKIYVNINKHYYKAWMYAGTIRSIINNSIIGLTKGFVKKLLLIGIGYKVYIDNNILYLDLGYSYTINYIIPLNIVIKCNNNEIIIKGYDKQLVGKVASEIRFFRKPECYKKGKGIRYIDEIVKIKEHKKKLNK